MRLIIFVEDAHVGIDRIRAVNGLDELLNNHSLKLETTHVLVISHHGQGIFKDF
jgi:hypothetical protein